MASPDQVGKAKPAEKRKAPAARRPQASGSRATKQRRTEQSVPEPSEPGNSFKGIFAKDLGTMMYGFGDSTSNPVPETLEAVEAIAIEFVRDILTRALENVSVKGKVDVKDLQFVLRKDVRKASRANEVIVKKQQLLKMKRVINSSNNPNEVEGISDILLANEPDD